LFICYIGPIYNLNLCNDEKVNMHKQIIKMPNNKSKNVWEKKNKMLEKITMHEEEIKKKYKGTTSMVSLKFWRAATALDNLNWI